MSMSAERGAADAEVFVYTGLGGDNVPREVIRVRIDPSVTSIPANAFCGRKKLAEVELCEGLVEIGEDAFCWCEQSITKINIPTSLRRINDEAFNNSIRTPIRLHDGLESIGQWAFANCIFTNFRVPPLITVIPKRIICNCRSTFSLELPHNVTFIDHHAFTACYCLRNVAFPPNAELSNDIFGDEEDYNEMATNADLLQLFGSEERNNS
jgi:hypothetical protein